MTLTDDVIMQVAADVGLKFNQQGICFTGAIRLSNFARAIEAEVHEELRKQEPVAFVLYDVGVPPCFTPVINGRYELKGDEWEPLYAAPIPPTDEIVEIKRQRDSAVGSLKWIHNAAKTGASIDVICGYTKGALQEVRLAAPIPPEPSPRIKDFSELRDELDAAPISPTIELATEYAEYILDHYDRKSKQDRQLLGKHLAEWADRRYRNAAPIPPDEPRLKRASLMAFGVISEIRKLVGNGKVQFVADLGGSIWTWPDAADSAITELRSVCFDTAPIPPTRIKDFSELRDELDAAPLPPTPNPSQQEALDALDNMDDYARMAGLIAIGPIETLRDFILARPDTEGSGK